MDIERTSGIIPPPGVEEFFQKNSSKILHHTCQNHAGQKKWKEAGLFSIENQYNQQRTKSIDRTDGTVEKTSVHKLFSSDGT